MTFYETQEKFVEALDAQIAEASKPTWFRAEDDKGESVGFVPGEGLAAGKMLASSNGMAALSAAQIEELMAYLRAWLAGVNGEFYERALSPEELVAVERRVASRAGLDVLYESVPSPGTSVLSACPEPSAGPPADVLTAFLEGASFAALGPDAEKRLRDELREIQAGIRVVIAGHEELRNLLKQANQLAGKLGVDAENAGRACFDEWDEDDFQLGYLVGIGDGFLRTSHLLSFLGNVLLVKTARIEAETAGGETTT